MRAVVFEEAQDADDDGITDAMDEELAQNFGREEEQKGLACHAPWGPESDMTGRLNNSNSSMDEIILLF